MEPPRIDWLLEGEPRPAQIEALNRSYKGIAHRNHRDEPMTVPQRALPHVGKPARGWGHFMQMRVGKTPTALNEYMLFKRDYEIKKCVILSPNQYKPTWVKEWKAFGVDAEAWAYESGKKTHKEALRFMELTDEGAMVVNYESMRNDNLMAALAEWMRDKTGIFADESVSMKNPKSGNFLNAMKLCRLSQYSRPMTGLPTPQAPYDYWSQLRFARQFNGLKFHPFKYRYTKMGGFQMKVPQGIKEEYEDELQNHLNDMCFRAKRGDWADVKRSIYEIADVKLNPELVRAYDQMEKDFVLSLEDGEVAAHMVITKHMKLQQISSGFVYDEEGNTRSILPITKTNKFRYLLNMLENEIDGKTLIIVHHKPVAHALMDELAKFNPACILGNTQMKARGVNSEDEKARFNEDPKCRIMIGQSQAIKYGHTLMGSQTDPCSTLVFYENNYSLDNRSQTEERPQGNGQVNPLLIIDYAQNKVEANIIKALQRKASVADVLMTSYKNK